MSRTDAPKKESRTTILRDLVVFQVKLWVEGCKDFVLMPLSLGAALIDLVFGSPQGRGALYSVMRLGDRFEQWIHLYGALGDPLDEENKHSRSASTVLNGATGIAQNRTSNGSTKGAEGRPRGSDDRRAVETGF